MAAPTALIKDLEGEVSVTRNGEVVNLKAGDALLPGDVVKTGSTGRLALEFPGLAGQVAAAGIMTANGKITLGEQEGPNGPQMVVSEDGDCFEFTTEVAENSAAMEADGGMGLFGALAGAGGGGALGLGALAAGAFVAGGGSDGGDSGSNLSTSGSGGNGGSGLGGGLNSGEFSSQDSPQSLQEFANQNLTQENLQTSLLDPITTAGQNSASDPASTPDNLSTGVQDSGMGGAENLHDLLVAATGPGTPQADVVNQLVDGLDATPLGEPLAPVTHELQSLVNTDIGLNTLLDAAPLDGLTSGGLVTSVVNTASELLSPVAQQVEPVGMVLDQLGSVAPQVDTVLDGLVGQLTQGLETVLSGGSSSGTPDLSTVLSQLNPDGLPAVDGLPSGDLLSAGLPTGDALPTSGLPTELAPLAGQVEGLLGGADTLTNALQGASSPAGGGGGEIINTVTSGISSGADALGHSGLPIDPTHLNTGI
ncbi:hypothetical protein NQT62_14145 [Limnobacter humi]|uniref:Retention module-containing protein n=1 Tax=Limnobacter humi TaxID=1778671 RepID=A0ABT1WL81_9BURK|nr:hypothetical protein [Limnobacter humi]MCQ8897579.1 hypothetical protein [Limnobacter humi]